MIAHSKLCGIAKIRLRLPHLAVKTCSFRFRYAERMVFQIIHKSFPSCHADRKVANSYDSEELCRHPGA